MSITLEVRVEKLEQTVASLRARVTALEDQIREMTDGEVVRTHGWAWHA